MQQEHLDYVRKLREEYQGDLSIIERGNLDCDFYDWLKDQKLNPQEERCLRNLYFDGHTDQLITI